MLGALIGDYAGSRFEFTRYRIPYDFTFYEERDRFTDDTVMSIAVAEAIMNTRGKSDEEIKAELVSSMRKWGRRYPDAGYGGKFYDWIFSADPKPYFSFGNGSAMRVSSIGWLFDTMEETIRMAELSASVTHNHPEGIKGAIAIAAAIFMARNKASKEEIRAEIEKITGYDLSTSYEDYQRQRIRSAICQDTVPEAIVSFLEAESFEDTIRKAIVLGGDTDTLAAMAGSIAEAYDGIEDSFRRECLKHLPADLKEVYERFESVL